MSDREFLDYSGLGYYTDKYNDQVNNITGAEYDSTATYSIDDYCIHDNKVYKCIASIDTAEEWTEEHWTHVNITDEIDRMDHNVDLITNTEKTYGPSSIVTFESETDGAPIRKITADINPVQDLHGYSNPWPAGGGANLFADAPMMNAFYAAGNNPTKSESALTVSFNGKDASVATGITFQENTQYTFIFTLSNTNANTGTNIVITYTGGEFRYIDKATNTNKQTIVYVSESDKTVSGISLVNAGGVTTIYCAESGVFKGVLSASQWTPYSNECPISGHTGAEIYDDPTYGGLVNWNQLAPELNNVNWNVNTAYGTVAWADEKVTYTITTKNTSQSVIRGQSIGGIPMIQGHKYFIALDALCSESSNALRLYVMDDQLVSAKSVVANAKTNVSWIIQSTQATGGNAFFGIYPNMATGLSVGATFELFNVMIFDLTQMFGSTIADYIYNLEQTTAGAGVAWFRNLFPKGYYQYNTGEETTVSAVNGDPHTILPITFPTTIYGGSDEVIGGALESTMGMVDLGTLTWTKLPTSGSNYWFRASLVLKDVPASTDKPNMLCSSYATETPNNVYTGTQGISKIKGYDYVVVCDMRYSDEATFKSAMSGVQLCYELAEPVEYDLTPQSMTTLYGTNNIFTNLNGDTTVTVGKYLSTITSYIDGTKSSILSLIAKDESSGKASTNYVANQFIIMNGKFYRVTTNVASGAAFVIGTNCVETTVGSQITALLNA